MLRVEQAGPRHRDLALDLHGLGVLTLKSERGHQVAGRGERPAVVPIEDASQLLKRASVECLRFCVLSQTAQHAGEVALCGERALVVWPERAGPRGERRPQEYRRPRVFF